MRRLRVAWNGRAGQHALYPRSRRRLVLYGTLITGVFVVDALTPLGLNVPILYLLPLLAAFLLDDVRLRVGLTAIVIVLTLAIIPALWSDAWRTGVVNRVLDVGVFSVALALSIRDARTMRELRDLTHGVDRSSIVMLTDRQGRVRHVNDRLCQISRYDRGELVGQDWRTLSADPASVADLWIAVGQGGIWHGEISNRAKDGSAYWTDATVVPFLREDGEPYQYLFISHDITERKRAEARLRQQAALARIGEMVALVAHEVRNPLAGVRAGLQMLGRGSSLAQADKTLLHSMIERLDLLNAHVTDLLHFARPRSPQLEPVSITALLERTARVAFDAGPRRAVEWRIVGPDAVVLADPAMLCEVFTHLFGNATDAVNGGGTVVITLARQGDVLDTTVTDTGPGIPPALHERVFEPFYTTKPGGSGLGLPIVKQLVELHGGRVALASSRRGTSITVRLPGAAQAGGVSSQSAS